MKADIGAINVLHCEERLPEGQVDHDAARGTNRPSPPDQGSRTADRTVISLRQIKPSPDLELRPQRLLPMAPRVQDAYAAAREWRATGGRTGLPCIEIGRTLRVPRTELDRLLGRLA